MVLSAIIENSAFLRDKYFNPCYGTSELPSLNLQNHTWLIREANGKIKNPYKTLPLVFSGIDNDELDDLCKAEGEMRADGGAAMMVYAKMQFTEMPNEKRDFYRKALLRYCELDTLAMVMIYEGWKDHLFKSDLRSVN